MASLQTVSAVGIVAPDICVRSFSVAVWSNLLTQIVRLEPLYTKSGVWQIQTGQH
jgi:hypothetical protein